MSDIFISYAKEDRDRAKALAEAFESQGWSVWWDRIIPAGRIFDDVIQEAIDQAKCIVVIWSRNSVGSRWVRTEAAEGAERKILVPVLIEEVKIPLAFRRLQAENFVDWDGTTTSEVFRKLVTDIEKVLAAPTVGTNGASRATKAETEHKANERVKSSEQVRKDQHAHETTANEAQESQRERIEAVRNASALWRGPVTTTFVVVGLVLAIWVFFYVTSEPLAVSEITVVAGFCAAVVFVGKWIWRRLRKEGKKHAAES